MVSFTKWFSSILSVVLMTGTAAAADAIQSGQIKSVGADKKEFVLTDAGGKDSTFKLGDRVMINRGGKEGQSDLGAGDTVFVCFDKGALTWTAHYILVREGDTKDCELVRGAVKGYDVSKRLLTFTDGPGTDMTLFVGDAKVRLNNKDGKVEDVKIGDQVLAIVERMGDKVTLKCVMVEPKGN